MNWGVTWQYPTPVDRTYIEAGSDDPPAVREAIDDIQRRLAADPHTAGLHLSEGIWRIDRPPLCCLYVIVPHLRWVDIVAVGTLPPPVLPGPS